MKEYARFLSKRIICRKSNIIMVVLSLVIVLIFLVMNIRMQGEFKDTLNAQIALDMKTIEKYEAALTDLEEGSDEYILMEGTIQLTQDDLIAFENFVKLVDKENWIKFYDEYSTLLEDRMRIHMQSSGSDSHNMIASQQKELTYFQYLKEHNLVYENSDFPISGVTFTTSISQIILPITIVALCIYILTQAFTLDYYKNHDLSMLFPISRSKVFLTKIMIGTGFTIFLYLFIVLFSFLLATMFSFTAGFEYPILIQNLNTGVYEAVNALSLCKDWLLLGILFCICISIFSYIVSLVIKEDIFLLLVLFFFIIGFAYLPTMIESLKSIAHVLPTTYMHYVEVASGRLAITYANTALSTSTGVSVLSTCIVVQFVICLLYNHLGKLKKFTR